MTHAFTWSSRLLARSSALARRLLRLPGFLLEDRRLRRVGGRPRLYSPELEDVQERQHRRDDAGRRIWAAVGEREQPEQQANEARTAARKLLLQRGSDEGPSAPSQLTAAALMTKVP
eukprot:CAMPEP_0181256348 /NCGR_PEP_ID=MMETSP1096-20121128/49662_1 /TAXON_ID=156174 ORGANISM="Chrysochromulina ericina, Strain CCMP281" /NCGR_SAMPLE_ID=MMETSP1096 /ASSEMBLY_ACC=CAM_ASM_000453 /LENGTH=116 /DNA_ID=CAMNT_0023354591 /DNA_START=57 /DNA_END=405 /DNA_ORIENTATION=-